MSGRVNQGMTGSNEQSEAWTEWKGAKRVYDPALRARAAHRLGVGAKNPAPRPAEIRLPKMRRLGMPGDWWLPSWVRKLVKSNASVDDLIAETLRRVLASPNETTILEAQAIVNELSRSPQNAPVVHKAFEKAIAETPLGRILRKA
jgi:hypothetical protein